MTADVVQFPQPTRRRSLQVTSWNADEDDALDALPVECQIIYLRVMRRHMDYATGIVGRVRRIGYDQILERLNYCPPAHSREKPRMYSRDQVKRLIQRLVDAGLLVRLHDTSKGVAPMAFYLPLADADGVPEEVISPAETADESPKGTETTPPRTNPHGCGAGEGNSATARPEISQQHRHGSATVTPPRTNPHGCGAGEGNSATVAPRQHRHPSGTSGVVEPNGSPTRINARESEQPGPTPESRAKGKRQPRPRPDAAIQSGDRKQWGTAEDLALAEWMAGLVDALPGGTERRSMAAWANDVRLMRERDGREHRHIRVLFAWANADPFWQVNIRSPSKLRTQWKPLAIKRNQERERAKAQEAHHGTAGRARTPARRLTAAEARERDRLAREGSRQGDIIDGEYTPRR